MNDSQQSYCGVSLSEVLGKTAAELLASDMGKKLFDFDSEEIKKLQGQMRAPHDRIKEMFEVRRRDGEWFRLYQSRTRDGGMIAFRIGITDIKQRERDVAATRHALETQQRQLNELAREARASMTAKKQFLAMMSHEIRTPLSAVVGFARLMSKASTKFEQDQFAGHLHRSATQLLTIVDDVLDFSKLDQGAVETSLSDFDLHHLLDSLPDVGMLFVGEDSRTNFKLDIDPDCPRVLRSDEGKVRQILQIFLTNAVKFAPDGRIEIGAEKIGRMLRISICDNGPGIAAQDLERLFEPFEQGQAGSELKQKGAGLGLAIAKRLARLLNGRVGAKSYVGEGSEFYLELPLEFGALPAAVTALPPQPMLSFASMRALIADDAIASRVLLRILLEQRGLQVTEAADGQEAMHALHGFQFDLVVTDLQMPGASGFDIAAYLGHSARIHVRQKIHLVALSALTGDDVRDEAIRCGFDAFISKPYSEERLDLEIDAAKRKLLEAA